MRYFVVLFVMTAQGPIQLGYVNTSQGNPQFFSKAAYEAMAHNVPKAFAEKGGIARCIAFPDVASM